MRTPYRLEGLSSPAGRGCDEGGRVAGSWGHKQERKKRTAWKRDKDEERVACGRGKRRVAGRAGLKEDKGRGGVGRVSTLRSKKESSIDISCTVAERCRATLCEREPSGASGASGASRTDRAIE